MVTSSQDTRWRELTELDSRTNKKREDSQFKINTRALSQPVSLYAVTLLRTRITFPKLDGTSPDIPRCRPRRKLPFASLLGHHQQGLSRKHGARHSHDGSRHAHILERPGLGRRSRRGHGSRLRGLHVEGQEGHCLCLVPADRDRTGQDRAGEHSMLLSPCPALTPTRTALWSSATTRAQRLAQKSLLRFWSSFTRMVSPPAHS